MSESTTLSQVKTKVNEPYFTFPTASDGSQTYPNRFISAAVHHHPAEEIWKMTLSIAYLFNERFATFCKILAPHTTSKNRVPIVPAGWTTMTTMAHRWWLLRKNRIPGLMIPSCGGRHSRSILGDYYCRIISSSALQADRTQDAKRRDMVMSSPVGRRGLQCDGMPRGGLKKRCEQNEVANACILGSASRLDWQLK